MSNINIYCKECLSKDAEIERLRGLLRDYAKLVSRLTYPEGEKQFAAEWHKRVREALGDAVD
jgi:hypothetical protein